MSRTIAKHTKSYRKNKMNKALGNGHSISRYFLQSTTFTHISSNHSSDYKKDGESDSEKEESVDNNTKNEDTVYNNMID